MIAPNTKIDQKAIILHTSGGSGPVKDLPGMLNPKPEPSAVPFCQGFVVEIQKGTASWALGLGVGVGLSCVEA